MKYDLVMKNDNFYLFEKHEEFYMTFKDEGFDKFNNLNDDLKAFGLHFTMDFPSGIPLDFPVTNIIASNDKFNFLINRNIYKNSSGRIFEYHIILINNNGAIREGIIVKLIEYFNVKLGYSYELENFKINKDEIEVDIERIKTIHERISTLQNELNILEELALK